MTTTEAKIDALFGAFTATSPGAAAAVVADGEVVFSKGYGVADLEQ
jgi:CubicO group peptidase (beta-lactamase class C family)